MFIKSDIICLKLLRKGPFYEEHLVCAGLNAPKPPKFLLRAMRKTAITLNEDDEKMVMIELMIRSKLRHPFLVNQISALQDYNYLYYLSDYAPTTLLKSNILPKKFTLEATKFYIAEIFLCLKYLHSKGQNYAFLSPRNIFVSADGHIKLDFSFCNCIENSGNIMCNIEYLSLDYLENHRFGYISDYWSLGIVMYQMLHGYTPFLSTSRDLTIAEMKKCKPIAQVPVDKETQNMLYMLIDRYMESKYPTCEEFEEAVMKHKYFEDIDWELLEKKRCEPPYVINIPEYDLQAAPKLNVLYTSDYLGCEKDGYGGIFRGYNTVHFLERRLGPNQRE